MKFALDTARRFVLTKAMVGWELVVDDKIVHYCREPEDALLYLADTLMFEDTSADAVQVMASLNTIRSIIVTARQVIDSVMSDRLIVRALRAAHGLEGRDAVKAAALAIAGCSEAEFKTRPHREQTVTRAKAILEAWHDDGRSGQESGRGPAEERAAGS